MSYAVSLGLFSNRWLLLGVLALVVTQLGFNYLSVLNELFHIAPIGLGFCTVIGIIGLSIHVLVGLEKWPEQAGVHLCLPTLAQQGF